jgi:hypothetical protein
MSHTKFRIKKQSDAPCAIEYPIPVPPKIKPEESDAIVASPPGSPTSLMKRKRLSPQRSPNWIKVKRNCGLEFGRSPKRKRKKSSFSPPVPKYTFRSLYEDDPLALQESFSKIFEESVKSEPNAEIQLETDPLFQYSLFSPSSPGEAEHLKHSPEVTSATPPSYSPLESCYRFTPSPLSPGDGIVSSPKSSPISHSPIFCNSPASTQTSKFRLQLTPLKATRKPAFNVSPSHPVKVKPEPEPVIPLSQNRKNFVCNKPSMQKPSQAKPNPDSNESVKISQSSRKFIPPLKPRESTIGNSVPTFRKSSYKPKTNTFANSQQENKPNSLVSCHAKRAKRILG